MNGFGARDDFVGQRPWRRSTVSFGSSLKSPASEPSVVVDFGLWARVERDEMRVAARGLGVRVELHYLDTPIDDCGAAPSPPLAWIRWLQVRPSAATAFFTFLSGIS